MADEAHRSHHSEDAHGEFAHVLPLKLLIGVWVGLMVLTFITVWVTRFDFGPSWNLGVAMIIATVKAGLVVTFFMHLLYDKLFHSILVLGGLLAALLFVGFLLMDSSQYQSDIIWAAPGSE